MFISRQGNLMPMWHAPLAQLAEHALRKRMVVGSIPTGGYMRILYAVALARWHGAMVRRLLRNHTQRAVAATGYGSGTLATGASRHW